MQPSISMLPAARHISDVSPGPPQPGKISVLACTKLGGTTAIAAYRALWPLEALAGRKDFGVCRAITQENLARLEQAGQTDDMRGYDIYVLQRILGRKEDHIGHFFDTLHSDGSKIIFDTDDRLDDEYRELGYADALRDTLEHVDMITVTTSQLAASMKKYDKPVYVAYNRLKTEWFHEVTQQSQRVFPDNIVVGLVGTRSHWGDWQLVIDALTKLRVTHPDVIVAIAGYYPPYFEHISGLKKFAPVPFEVYPALLKQFDIILCPLDVDDLFNHAKSAVGALEAMAAARSVNGGIGGAVPIVSSTKFYRRVVNHRNNGLVVRNSAWYDAIAEVVDNHVLRQKMQLNGWKWVRKHREIGQADDWARAYKQITRR